MRKRFAGMIMLLILFLEVMTSGASAEPRDEVVAHAYEVLNWEWHTDGYVVLHYSGYEPDTDYEAPSPALFSANRPLVATGTLRGIPYTLSANGNGRERTLSEYKELTDAERLDVSNVYGYGNNGHYENGIWIKPTIQYWRVGMKYGMSCATFVWDCLSQVLPLTRTAGSPNIPSLWGNYLTKTSYSNLEKGDILQKIAHVMLVVDNNPASGYLTVIEQAPPDIGVVRDAGTIYLPPHGYYNAGLYDTYTVGTREKTYWYTDLDSYTAYKVDYSEAETKSPVIVTDSLPDAYIGEPYYAEITATGTKPITYSYGAVAYSHGFLLDGQTPAFETTNGIINGTPKLLASRTPPYTVNITITAEN